MLQALTVLTEVFRENVKNGRVKQGLLPAIGELVYLAASQVSQGSVCSQEDICFMFEKQVKKIALL